MKTSRPTPDRNFVDWLDIQIFLCTSRFAIQKQRGLLPSVHPQAIAPSLSSVSLFNWTALLQVTTISFKAEPLD
jgi:hypothetical protein